MNRSSSSSSKTGRKCSPAPVQAPLPANSQIQRRKKQSPRSPLKDLNGIISSSSSNASSTSIEAPRGCLRFFLSNSSSRTPLQRPKSLSKTPKSAPIVRPSKPSRSKPRKDNPPDLRPTSQKVHKSKKNPPCLYQWQSGKIPVFKVVQRPKSSPVLSKSASGSEELKQQQQQQLVDDAGETIEFRLSGFKAGSNDGNFTPVSKLVRGSGLDCTFDKVIQENSNTTLTTTPPIEASVSPEIQCGSSVVSRATPACYGAGHVVSGVSDKRKCRPRGVLAIGESDLGLGIAKAFDGFGNDDENVVGVINSSRVSIVPVPAEASMHWLLSPCDEKDEDTNELTDNGSHPFRRLVGSTTPHSPSSPSSGHGFSSNACNSSNNTTTSTSTTTTTTRRRTSLLSPSALPELQGFLGPSSDHIVDCSLPCSPHATPSCKATVSQKEKKYHCNLARENSPFSIDSLGSGNVIQTPQSDSSSDRHVGLAWLNAVDEQKCQLESELDSVADVLRTTSFSPKSQISMWDPAGSSFQFDSLPSPSNSIDFTQLQKTWDCHASWISDSTLENVSQSHMRISWREGLVSRIFEMDEFDCCRCLSDEEEDAKGCSDDQFQSCPNPKLTVDLGSTRDQSLTNALRSTEFVDHELGIDEKSKEKVPLQKPSSCAESISTDGGDLVASGDSDWNLCYKNHLFQFYFLDETAIPVKNSTHCFYHFKTRAGWYFQ